MSFLSFISNCYDFNNVLETHDIVASSPLVLMDTSELNLQHPSVVRQLVFDDTNLTNFNQNIYTGKIILNSYCIPIFYFKHEYVSNLLILGILSYNTLFLLLV